VHRDRGGEDQAGASLDLLVRGIGAVCVLRNGLQRRQDFEKQLKKYWERKGSKHKEKQHHRRTRRRILALEKSYVLSYKEAE